MRRFHLGVVLSGVLGVVLLGPTGSGGADALACLNETAASDARTSPLITANDGVDRPLVLVGSTTAPHGSSGASAGGSGHGCPVGMVDVQGEYCPNVEQTCLRWLDPETKMRCAEFAATGACTGKPVHKHFCIDEFEYPNTVGARPVVMKTFFEARDACGAEGKRLCGDSEWTLACEGQERLPYPYGYARNPEACNIDKPHPDPDIAALEDPKTRDAEVNRLDQRAASGERAACVSPFGVHDMTGNVDEWVVNESGRPYQSGLKGGYWGPVRTRCRPMTIAHSEQFSFYQIGFRCCADSSPNAGVAAAAPRSPRPARSGS